MKRQVYTGAMHKIAILRTLGTLATALNLLLFLPATLYAQPAEPPYAQPAEPPFAKETPALPNLTGTWVFNKAQSDNTDKKVEAALREAGEKITRRFWDQQDDYYRGGPPEQELYDRMSYDRLLEIEATETALHFTYADEFERVIYTDNRSRSVSLNQLESLEDFSLGHWENDKLLVEAHPRDGGIAQEIYTLINGGAQLQVEFHIQPRTFQEPIELIRVFDRQPDAAPAP